MLQRLLEFRKPPDEATPEVLRLLNDEIWQSGTISPGLELNPDSGTFALAYRVRTLRGMLYAALLLEVSIHGGEMLINTATTTKKETTRLTAGMHGQRKDEKIARARAAMENKGISLREAARRNDIPPSTLSERNRSVRKSTKPDTKGPSQPQKQAVDS